LSKVERQRLSQFPDEVTDADCIVHFTLTPADKDFVSSRRSEENQLGMALLLCSLRYLGYFPVNIKRTPENVVTFVADQLQLSPADLVDYADREETRWEQLPLVRQHLGFRRVRHDDRNNLIAWLGERALEHDRPNLLLQQGCERLYQLRLVRPAVTTMEELVADARQWAEAKSIEVLVNPLPTRIQKALDTLLVHNEERGKAPVLWLRRFATGHSDKKILEALEKLAFIRQWAVTTWQVDELPPSRLKNLAQIARYTSTQGLKRKKPEGKRYAILVAHRHQVKEKHVPKAEK
jgi:hypothetical protein